jgi:hypothetical protein
MNITLLAHDFLKRDERNIVGLENIHEVFPRTRLHLALVHDERVSVRRVVVDRNLTFDVAEDVWVLLTKGRTHVDVNGDTLTPEVFGHHHDVWVVVVGAERHLALARKVAPKVLGHARVHEDVSLGLDAQVPLVEFDDAHDVVYVVVDVYLAVFPKLAQGSILKLWRRRLAFHDPVEEAIGIRVREEKILEGIVFERHLTQIMSIGFISMLPIENIPHLCHI